MYIENFDLNYAYMLMFDDKIDIQKSAGVLFLICNEEEDLKYIEAIKLYVTYQVKLQKKKIKISIDKLFIY